MNNHHPHSSALTPVVGRRCALTVLVAVYTVLSLSAAASVHVGEDGIEYGSGHTIDRGEWLYGKIEPDVTVAAATRKDVDLAVYVARPAPQGRSTDPVAEIKERYRSQIAALGEQMRGIWRSARPSKSLSEEEERDYILTRGAALSRADEDAVRTLQAEHDALRTAMHKDIGRALDAAGQAERIDVSDFVARLGGTVHAQIPVTNALAVTLPSASLVELARHPLVVTVALDMQTLLELDNSTASAGFDDWHGAADGPFLGGAYDAGVVDTGVQEDHPGFSNVDSFYSNFAGTDSNSHGTHVAGIIANDTTTYVYGGPYPGAATNLDAFIWGRSSNTQATTMARMDDLMTDFAQSPEVVNHSLGYSSVGGVPSGPVSTNDYVSNDSFYDAFVRNYDVQVTKSAGNSGWGASATMTYPANAYNILVVANMNDRNTLTRTDDVRSTTSSVGPTRNGRRKPDISAPGTSIISTNAFWNSGVGSTPTAGCAGNGTDMCTKSGTSMAAPHVAGAIILQHEGGNLDAQAQKAVLLNTADWWDSSGTSSTADDGRRIAQSCPGGFDPCQTPWDRSYGWGYLDMTEALFNRADWFTDVVVPRNDNAVEDDYELYKGTMFTNEKATLVWEKRADTYVAGGTAGGQRALADLNIRLYAESDGSVMDGDFVGNDNVHQVAADRSGTAVIKVYAWSTSFDGSSTERFWLATEENFARISPPSFSATPLIPLVGPFQTFTAPTSVTNTGGAAAHNVNVAIGNIAGVSGDGTSQNIGTLAEGVSEQVDFTITTTGLSAGVHTIPVTVSSASYDETYTNSAPTGVQFSVETTPPTGTCSALPTFTNADSISIPWSATDGFFGTGVASAALYVVTPGSATFVATGLTQNGSSGSFNYNFAAGDGSYRFAVRATDVGGNVESAPGSTECSVAVDRVDPQSVASTPASVPAGQIPISWSWTDATPSSGLDSVDLLYALAPDGAWNDTGLSSNAANGVLNWTPPGPGVYRFATRSADRAGNSESAPAVEDYDASTVFGGVDTDGDGVLDGSDNCVLVINPDQRDTNGDGYGNICDADLDNNGIVNPIDLGLFRAVFFSADADADFNGDGVVNPIDLGILRAAFFQPPGPSGVAP